VAGGLLCIASGLPGGRPRNDAPPRRSESPPRRQGAISFADITLESGLGAFRHVSGVPAKDFLIETMGAGCALVDFDGDGWLDVYLVNGGTTDALLGRDDFPAAALYQNRRDGTFVDVAVRAGVTNDRWGQGVCAGDFNNDGWPDLYVTNYGRSRLYRNNRDGTFTDVAETAGVTSDGWSSGAAFGDFDRDGLPDLFVAGYVDYDPANPPPSATGPAPAGLTDTLRGIAASYAPGAAFCQYRGVRVNCGPRGLKGLPDRLFRNLGNGRFDDVSSRAGVADKLKYYGLGVAWLDVDDDGWVDLFVANDSQPNYLYRNLRDGTFEETAFLSGTALSDNGSEQACMGIAVGDYDGDGRNDIHMTNFADDSNVLYRNTGDGAFEDRTFAAGLGDITMPYVGWGTDFLDIDHDGLLDLLAVNGHVYPQADGAGWGSTYRQRLLLFRSRGAKFMEVGAQAGEGTCTPRVSRGSAVGDIDNDGDLDILAASLDGTPALLRNEGGRRAGNWLILKLVGDPAMQTPRDSVGSVVFCTSGGKRIRREVASGRSYLSQSDNRLHFGLGDAESIERLEVRWAGGLTREYRIRGVNRVVTIDQRTGVR
jgi:hypothetical protein